MSVEPGLGGTVVETAALRAANDRPASTLPGEMAHKIVSIKCAPEINDSEHKGEQQRHYDSGFRKARAAFAVALHWATTRITESPLMLICGGSPGYLTSDANVPDT